MWGNGGKGRGRPRAPSVLRPLAAHVQLLADHRHHVAGRVAHGRVEPAQYLAAVGRRFRFGPARPDLLLHERGCDLVVVSCRPKPDWNERVTIALGTRFYRVLRSEERPDRGYRGFAYLLQESDSTEVIRGLVRYEPG